MADSKYQTKSTTNYDKFSTLMSNRNTQAGHIKNLKEALKEKPEILEAQPILVNDKYQIIDGQHRFEAASELGLPIFYTVVPNIGIETARSMNVLQRAWKPEDFAKSYAVTGNKHYQEYLRAREDFELGHNVTLVAMAGVNKSAYKNFKTGDFEIDNLNQAREWMARLNEYNELMEIPMQRNLALALFQIFRNPTFDHARMLQKLKDAGPEFIKRQGSNRDYLRSIEDVYNYNAQPAGRVRLFD